MQHVVACFMGVMGVRETDTEEAKVHALIYLYTRWLDDAASGQTAD